jgi:peroxiredoxin
MDSMQPEPFPLHRNPSYEETMHTSAPPPSPSVPILAEQLAQIRRRNPDLGPFYDEVVIGLRAVGVGEAALAVGDTFPDFALPNARGGLFRLGDLLASGPVVLNFSRGRWCPYCAHEISAWSAMLPALAEAGARFVEITGETGGAASAIAAGLAGPADVLCDVDHGLALSLGLAFFAGEPLLDFYRKRGLDFNALYGSDSGFLPVPGTFAVDRDGTVLFAHVDVDFRNRAEPADVIAALAAA